jgi:CheY-like chemotaxis protein
MQSVGTLAGGVAHEFNNLLAGIQGYAALGLREKKLPGAAREFLEFIVQLSERAANLTKQLLAFARKPALIRQPTVMEKLVRSTADLVQHSLNLEVVLDIEAADPPLEALADANQLQQVMVNLSLNAKDAMPQPAPKPLEFRLWRQVLEGMLPAFPQNIPTGDYVVLEVRDHGHGMAPEIMAQALDPFFTTKDIGQGTGLGLPVVFGIVQGHQGYLTIDSAVEQGTRMRMYLPRLTHRPAGAPAPAIGAQVLEPEPSPGRTILVIDDEDAVLDVIRRFLEIAGHQVICASSAAKAFELLAGGAKPDVIRLDLMIPREVGGATFSRLQTAAPQVPILLCTGLVQTDLAQQLLQQGAMDLLRKPFRMNELWYAVSKAMAPRT